MHSPALTCHLIYNPICTHLLYPVIYYILPYALTCCRMVLTSSSSSDESAESSALGLSSTKTKDFKPSFFMEHMSCNVTSCHAMSQA